MVKYYSLIKCGRVKFRNLANGNSKQNHEIISKINLNRHCNWNSGQLTFMSFLEPYNYCTQMSMDVKCGLPLWGQDFTTMC